MDRYFPDGLEAEYITYEQALRIARSEALRDLKESQKSIGYIAHVQSLHDYCFCEFVPQEDGWIKTIRGLMPDERLPEEEIQDKTIMELAQSGQMITAIRLYRSKHQVDLRIAHEAVNALRYGGDQSPHGP